ncbi:MAG: hypothetical protein ACOCRO_04360 [Halanaerobiales bacterium]
MKKSEFIKRLKKDRISERYYSLTGGTPNDKLCIEKIPGGWEVYYSERGDKYRVEKYRSEEDAYDSLYKRLKSMVDVN